MTGSIDVMDVVEADVVVETSTILLERIDKHLAALPVDRKLITLDEHTDILLDLRNLVNQN